jgi:hypothetical protein
MYLNINDTVIHNKYKNHVFIEFLGNGFFGSLNYDRNIYYLKKYKLGFNGRIGFFAWEMMYPRTFVSVPLSIMGIYVLSKKWEIEFGIGKTLFFDGNIDNRKVDVFANCGINRKIFNRTLIKINFTPFFNTPNCYMSGRKLWFGLSIGYSFGKR